MPPSRLAPWHVAQFWAYSVAPFCGSPGSVVAPLAVLPGEGEVSASVESAVRMKKAGIPTARRRPLLTRIQAKSYLAPFPPLGGNTGGRRRF